MKNPTISRITRLIKIIKNMERGRLQNEMNQIKIKARRLNQMDVKTTPKKTDKTTRETTLFAAIRASQPTIEITLLAKFINEGSNMRRFKMTEPILCFLLAIINLPMV
jgi:hypothetical protein